MNISKFFGATNREAMRQVRLALGSDALIISNQRVNGGVEILASDATEIDRAKNTASTKHDTVINVADLIGDLRGSIESRFNDLLWVNSLSGPHAAITLFQNMLAYGFSTALVRAMFKALPNNLNDRAALSWARSELIKNLPVLAAEKDLWQTGATIALVGPTGVGKTTTVAKMAARFVHQYGAENLVLLSTDNYRIGAYEQLKIYGQLLKVPVYVAKNQAELHNHFAQISKDKTILIDNSGISQRDSHIAAQASMLANNYRQVSRLLVLNAASHGDTLDEVVKTYLHDGGSKPIGCVISKTDESTRLAAPLDIAIRYRLKIHYVSNGQKVPENLHLPEPSVLVDKAIYTKISTASLYAPSPADLSALLSVAKPEQNAEIESKLQRQKVLLPRLLIGNMDNKKIGLTELQNLIKQIDNYSLLADTYDLWEAKQKNILKDANDLINHSRSKINSLPPELKTIVHIKQALPALNNKGLCFSSVCFGQHGVPLASLGQQIGYANAWFSQQGNIAHRPTVQEAMFNQINNENYLIQGKKLHVFDGASKQLISRLINNQISFVAVQSAQRKVYMGGEEFLMSALARQQNMQLLDRNNFANISNPAGIDITKISWWFSSKNVQIAAKDNFYPVQMINLQAINTASGKPVKSWFAITNAKLPDEALIKALLLRNEYQMQMRYMRDEINTDTDLLAQAFYSSQCGLASWYLVQNPNLNKASDICSAILGRSKLGLNNAFMALSKLYALKGLLD